jgi:hypothetical protein
LFDTTRDYTIFIKINKRAGLTDVMERRDACNPVIEPDVHGNLFIPSPDQFPSVCVCYVTPTLDTVLNGIEKLIFKRLNSIRLYYS